MANLLESAIQENSELRGIVDSLRRAQDGKCAYLEDKIATLEQERCESLQNLEMAVATLEELSTEKDALEKDLYHLRIIINEQEVHSNGLAVALKNLRDTHYSDSSEARELREKLESLAGLIEKETVLEHLLTELGDDLEAHKKEFSSAYEASNHQAAASACVKMQYLEKLLLEAEQIESELMDNV